MADTKISALTELTAVAAGDLIPIVDISEANTAIKTKRITWDNLVGGAWATWTPTWYGWNGTPTGQFYYRALGKTIFINVAMAAGTSNQTYASFTLPVAATTATNHYGVCGYAVDNGSVLTVPAIWAIIYDQPTVVQLGKAYGALQAWTNSGTKRVIFQAFYQAA